MTQKPTTSTLDRKDATATAPTLRSRYLDAQAAILRDPASVVNKLSVVVPVLDQPALTTACADALFAKTPCATELILIDNGSSPETKAALEDIRRRHPTTRILVNSKNQGFAYATNQGLAAATGDWVLLLNNDVILGKNALLRMLALGSLDRRFGLIGPMTNRASGPQQTGTVTYTQWDGIDAFADQYAARFEASIAQTARLVGLCLLMHRCVLDKIGGLDPIFYPGNFEDDDLCLRAVRAGFKPVIAGDAYVHHEGGATFRAAKFDYKRAMQDNWDYFCAKHGHQGALGPYPAKVLAESRPFDPAIDRVPFDSSEVFHPNVVPLALDGVKRHATLLFADAEATPWMNVLEKYVARFGAQDERTLVIRVEPPTPRRVDEVIGQIQSVSAASGKTDAQLPDLLLDATPLPPALRGKLYRAAQEVLLAKSTRDAVYAREAQLSGIEIRNDVTELA